MRVHVFRMILGLLNHLNPGFFASFELQVLMRITAKAYDVPAKVIWYKPYKNALQEYGAFTVRCMRERKADKRRLYKTAYAAGNRLRRLTGFRERKDIESLVFYLYRNIGITMKGDIPGELLISECYFAGIYRPYECRIMSMVDSGMIAGISGGGRLTFSNRITEGCENCRACFSRNVND